MCGAKMEEQNNGDYVKYEDALKLAPRWIPVEERLPEINQRILAYGTWYEDGMYTAEVCSYGRIANRASDVCFWTASHIHPVTHWMPLPDAPKKGE
jgi:hypothetical protein